MTALLRAVVWLVVSGLPIFGAAAGGQDRAAEQDHRDLGRTLFLRHCAECHGASGDGFGPRQEITYARPRSFTTGRFKLSTTVNRIPSDQDLMRTIRNGMPGSGMPSWSQLDPDEILALARYVRSLGVDALRRSLEEEVEKGMLNAAEAAARLAERTTPGVPIELPPEPPTDDRGLWRGAEIHREACSACHGAEGDAPPGSLKTDLEGNWLLPTSLSKGLFKGGSEGGQLYARILKGVDGTAMPGFEGAYSGEDLWHLVHFVQGLSSQRLPADLVAQLAQDAESLKTQLASAGPFSESAPTSLPGTQQGSERSLEEEMLRLAQTAPPVTSLDRIIAISVVVAGVLFLVAILRRRKSLPRPSSPAQPSGPRSLDR